MMNNEAFASAFAGILFGFSALSILNDGQVKFHAVLLIIAAVLMFIHACRIHKKQSNCKTK